MQKLRQKELSLPDKQRQPDRTFYRSYFFSLLYSVCLVIPSIEATVLKLLSFFLIDSAIKLFSISSSVVLSLSETPLEDVLKEKSEGPRIDESERITAFSIECRISRIFPGHW